jgi:hypothetical protein
VPGRLFVVRGKAERLAADARADDARAVEEVARDRRGRPAAHGRERPLVVAAGPRDPEAIATRAAELHEAAAEHDLDVALVAPDEPAHLAAQERRAEIRGAFADLSADHLERSRKLGALAARGGLVLFVGAGVSAAAGMPLWGQLLDLLAVEAQMTSEERAALAELHPLDRARLLERRLGDRRQLLKHVRAHFSGDRAALGHLLLAGLPVREVVTTNYDSLIELASRDLGLHVGVLPDDPSRSCDRWVFKIHGSVDGTDDDDLVVTREDVLRFPDRRAALAGIVQALLITRHMLFVGFSLEDESFHRIADAVRRAIRPAGDEPFGTVLTLGPRPLVEELWRGELDLFPVAAGGVSGPVAARQAEIFLDRLAADAALLRDDVRRPNGSGAGR